MLMRRSSGRRLRTALPVLAALAVLGPLGWMWASSFVPSEYTATEMGYVDDGGVPVPGGHDHGAGAGGVPVASPVSPTYPMMSPACTGPLMPGDCRCAL